MTTPQVCVTVTARTMDELRAARDAAEHADLVELRLDFVDRPDVELALRGRSRPVVVTCRPVWQGGGFVGPEDERRQLLLRAQQLGAEFVDIEAAAAFAGELIANARGRGVVVSSHFFGETPPDLRQVYAAMRGAGAEVLKLAVEVDRLSALDSLFALADDSGPQRQDHVLIGMGAAGLPTRILAARLRNRWTYAGPGVAPGQVRADRLLHEFGFERIRPDAPLYGVVGNPVLHSLSPAMHNAGFAQADLDSVYVPLQARSANDFVAFARRHRLQGASITAPFKIDLMAAMDWIDPLARRVGAVNTLIVRDGAWHGANTDLEGLLDPLRGHIDVRGARVTILGAGGAARAAAVGLSDGGARVTISARRLESGTRLAGECGASVETFPPPPDSWDVLVNATPCGSHAQPGNPMGGVPLTGTIVFDLVYAPERTELLAAAARAGCTTIGGLEMLIAQAERQFELWTGARPHAGLFRQAAGDAIRSRSAHTADVSSAT
jgi:3-dehydroquinate dehydratase / shikimate dehydrogenase